MSPATSNRLNLEPNVPAFIALATNEPKIIWDLAASAAIRCRGVA